MEENLAPQNYLASVSDMMAGLLFIFMIVLMGFVYEAVATKTKLEEQSDSLKAAVEDYEKIAATRNGIESELKMLRDINAQLQARLNNQAIEIKDLYELKNGTLDTLVNENVRVRSQILTAIWQRLDNRELVSIDHDSGVLRLGEDYLGFSSGSTVTDSQDNLANISRVLTDALICKPESQEKTPTRGTGAFGYLKSLVGLKPSTENTVKIPSCLPYTNKIEALFIEGHTDNVPLGKAMTAKTGLKDNRELSTIRAVHTYNQMLKYSPDLAKVKNEKGLPVISVSGYGEDRPVKGHEWRKITNDPVNRRIDIRIIMSPFIQPTKN